MADQIPVKSERYLRSCFSGKIIQLNQNAIFPNIPDPETTENSKNDDNNNNLKRNNSRQKLIKHAIFDQKVVDSYNTLFIENKTKHNDKDKDSINSIMKIEKLDNIYKRAGNSNEQQNKANATKKEKETNLIQMRKENPANTAKPENLAAKVKVNDMKNAINQKANTIIENLDSNSNKNLIVLERLNYDKCI